MPEISNYAITINAALNVHFRDEMPRLIAERARTLVGDAGIIVSEVVIVSKKSTNDAERLVYLDVGRFHGLAETECEGIRYHSSIPDRRDSSSGPAIIADATCDSLGTLYGRNRVEMPVHLRFANIVFVYNTGAYAATHSSRTFNGFPPLQGCLVEDKNQTKFPKFQAV